MKINFPIRSSLLMALVCLGMAIYGGIVTQFVLPVVFVVFAAYHFIQWGGSLNLLRVMRGSADDVLDDVLVYGPGAARPVSEAAPTEPAAARTEYRGDGPLSVGELVTLGILQIVLTAAGVLLAVLPGVLFMTYAMYSTHFVVARGLGAREAITASFRLVHQRFFHHLGLVGVSMVLYALALVTGWGAVLCVPVAASISMLIVAQSFYRQPARATTGLSNSTALALG